MARDQDFEDYDIDTAQSQDSQDDFYPDDLGYDGFYDDMGMSPADRHNDLFKRLTDFEKFIKKRVQVWLGHKWDAKKQEWIESPDITPVMNQRGAEWCAGFLENYARDNNLITHFENKDDYVDIIGDVIEVLWLNIPVRMTEFGVPCVGDALRICNEMEHDVRLVLLGAARGGYNDLFTKTTARHESVNLTPMMNYAPQPRKRRGIGDRLKSIFGGG